MGSCNILGAHPRFRPAPTGCGKCRAICRRTSVTQCHRCAVCTCEGSAMLGTSQAVAVNATAKICADGRAIITVTVTWVHRCVLCPCKSCAAFVMGSRSSCDCDCPPHCPSDITKHCKACHSHHSSGHGKCLSNDAASAQSKRRFQELDATFVLTDQIGKEAAHACLE